MNEGRWGGGGRDTDGGGRGAWNLASGHGYGVPRPTAVFLIILRSFLSRAEGTSAWFNRKRLKQIALPVFFPFPVHPHIPRHRPSPPRQEYIEIVLEGNYQDGRGWGGKYGWAFGGAQIQGICAYYYGR